jgi:MFS family permease
VTRLGAYVRSLDPRLPRSVWTLEAGGFANALGNGIAFPFLVIYLHNVRGFSLGLAGAVLATIAAAGIAANPVAGSLVDRFGGRPTLAVALVLLAVGFGLYPLIREPWHAFALTLVSGAGNGMFWPSQSALIAGLTPATRRHGAYSVQRVSRNLGLGLGGAIGGLIATTDDPTSFTVIFALDAATFLVYICVLAVVPEPPRGAAEPGMPPTRYLEVLRDRVLLGVVGLNIAYVAAGYAVWELLPVFAKNEAGVSERQIGLIFFVNTLVIVVAQLPLTKLLEGRRRMKALAAMTLHWAFAMLVVLAGGAWTHAAVAAAVFVVAAVVFGLGECFHGPTQAPLVADLAPDRLRGRYMALGSLSWEVGFLVGPAVGGVVLGTEPLALWPLAAFVCLLAGAGALALERDLPRELRLTPA